jgi:multiple sugar transport system substrate-binding protein
MARRRTLFAAAVAVGLTLAVAGCGDSDGDSAGAPTELTYWSRGANERINKLLVDAWNASHDVKVELLPVPDAEYNKKLAAAVQAGSPPDVVTVDIVNVPELLRGNALTDVTDRAKALPYFDQLAQSYVKHATKDGKLYALPENVDASTLFWNKDLFAKAGLDPEKPPRTFAEIEQYAAKITALGGGVHGFYFPGQCAGCNNYTFSPLVWASGGDFVNADGTRSTLTDPAVADSLALYQRLWKAGSVPPEAKADTGANWVTSFGQGKVGMVGLGAFAIGQMQKDYPGVKYGVTTLPGRTGGESSFTGGDVIAVPSGAEHVDAAWEFVEWSLTEAAQVEVYAKDGGLVARSDLIKNKYATDPNVVAENEALLVGRLPVYYPNAAQIDAPTGPYSKAFQDIVFNGKQPGPVLEAAQQDFQKLLDQG